MANNHLVVILDTSGSMRNPFSRGRGSVEHGRDTKIDVAKDLIASMLIGRGGDVISVIPFSGDTGPIRHFSIPLDANILFQFVHALPVGTSTNLAEALRCALTLDVASDEFPEPIIGSTHYVLVTDGRSDSPIDDLQVVSSLLGPARAHANGLARAIDTIYIDPHDDITPHIKRISVGGRVIRVHGPDELAEALTELSRRADARHALQALSWFVEALGLPADAPIGEELAAGIKKLSGKFEEDVAANEIEEGVARLKLRAADASAEIKNRGSRRVAVIFGGSAPRRAAPDEEFTVRFVISPASDRRGLLRFLRALRRRRTTQPSTSEWDLGTKGVVKVHGKCLTVHHEPQPFEWNGTTQYFDFDVTVSTNQRTGQLRTRVKFDVIVDDLVVAKLRLPLTITRHGPLAGLLRAPWARPMKYASMIRTAFASYARPDYVIVANRVASLRIALNIDVFMDKQSMQPNDVWRERLASEIEGRTLFWLFWSKHAARSDWVRWEVEHAIRRRGIEAIQLHPLDSAASADDLPPELSHLHSSDPTMAGQA